ncbi:MAG: hypothetical protein RL094_347 [Candidatus Parcubacteria bacterium]
MKGENMKYNLTLEKKLILAYFIGTICCGLHEAGQYIDNIMGDRLMVGHPVLVRRIGVRVPIPQQNKKAPLSSGAFLF